MHGEYPIAVVWVDTEPDAVDVNIHPTKSQVKFEEPSMAFRAVAASLRTTLEQAPWLPVEQRPRGPEPLQDVSSQDYHSTKDLPNFAQTPTVKENLSFQDSSLHVTQFQKKGFHFNPSSSTVEQPKVDYQVLSQAASSRDSFTADISARSLQESEATRGYWSSLEILGQAHLTYIVTQARDKLVLLISMPLMSVWSLKN